MLNWCTDIRRSAGSRCEQAGSADSFVYFGSFAREPWPINGESAIALDDAKISGRPPRRTPNLPSTPVCISSAAENPRKSVTCGVAVGSDQQKRENEPIDETAMSFTGESPPHAGQPSAPRTPWAIGSATGQHANASKASEAEEEIQQAGHKERPPRERLEPPAVCVATQQDDCQRDGYRNTEFPGIFSLRRRSDEIDIQMHSRLRSLRRRG